MKQSNNSDLLHSISPLFQGLSNLIQDYESVLVKVSQRLPNFEAKIKSKIKEVSLITDALFEQKSGDSKRFEVGVFFRELENTLDKLKLTKEEDQKNFDEIKKTIGISKQAIDKMESVFQISEDLKVFAINSIIHSNRAGEHGRGYQIISSEFIRLSENIASGAHTISKAGTQLNSHMSSLIALFQEHENFTNENLETISKNTESFLHTANSNIQGFLKALQKHLDSLKKIQDPVGQIMVEIQRQDIIHQQLVHLLDTIGDLKDLSVNEEVKSLLKEENLGFDLDARVLLTVLDFLIVTIDKQLTRLENDMMELLQDLGKSFDLMSSTIIEAQGYVENDSTSEGGKNPFISLIFNAPKGIITEIQNSIATSTKQKEGIIGAFSQMDQKITLERQQTQSFLPVIKSINNLLLLAKIEQARYGIKLKSSSEKELASFEAGNFNDLEKIILGYEQFTKQIKENIKQSTEALLNQKNRYKEIVLNMNNSLILLETSEKKVRSDFEQIKDQSRELVGEIRSFDDYFKKLQQSMKDLEFQKNQSLKLGTLIREKVNSQGGLVPLEECKAKNSLIQKIIDKCTVDAERVTIQNQFSDLDIEESGSSDITLF